MAVLVMDRDLEEKLKAEREASGADRFDEAWEGVYSMSPLADNEHQAIQSRMGAALQNAVGWNSSIEVRTGVNVSDREVNWKDNYRVPDVAVFLPNGAARNCGTFWLGGPDFLAEIISPYDRTREKMPFYEQVAVREALLVDRDTWALELYRSGTRGLKLVARVSITDTHPLASEVLPVSFRLVAEPRPQIEVIHTDGVQRWLVEIEKTDSMLSSRL